LQHDNDTIGLDELICRGKLATNKNGDERSFVTEELAKKSK